MVRGCNVIYHLKQFSLSYEHFNPYIQLCISPQNSDLDKKLNITGGTLKGELRIEDNYLYLIASNAYSFLIKTDKSGKVVFYNHDFVPIMSLDYTGNLIVKGAIVSNRTPI